MRITQKDLEAVVERINTITGSPKDTWIKDKGSQIGNYHLYYAYGGVNLHRISNISGGVSTPVGSFTCTKRELYDKMQAYIYGLRDAEK
jgi:hypothetical protein